MVSYNKNAIPHIIAWLYIANDDINIQGLHHAIQMTQSWLADKL